MNTQKAFQCAPITSQSSASGTIPHTDGRVDGASNAYVVGWIKRGPSGVIGSNKKDSHHTVETLLTDLKSGDLNDFSQTHSAENFDWLSQRQPQLITDDHWQLIDEQERTAGEPRGRPRVKVSSVADLLKITHGASARPDSSPIEQRTRRPS